MVAAWPVWTAPDESALRGRRPGGSLEGSLRPFVPVAPFLTDDVRRHPSLSVVITADGGHCAFVEAEGPGYDGYWAEREVVRFAEAQRLRATTDAGKPTPSTVSR